MITSYTFDKLPQPPREVMLAHLSWAWVDMTPDRFAKILMTFGDYWATRGQDPDTWGMFADLVVSHQAGGRFGMSVQFCNPDGTCKDLRVLTDYLDRFQDCKPVSGVPGSTSVFGSPPASAAILDRGPVTVNERRAWSHARTTGHGQSSVQL